MKNNLIIYKYMSVKTLSITMTPSSNNSDGPQVFFSLLILKMSRSQDSIGLAQVRMSYSKHPFILHNFMATTQDSFTE